MQSPNSRRVWAGFGLLLFLVTWRIWIPQTEFPQIPFFAALTVLPLWMDWIGVAAVLGSLLLAGFAPREGAWRSAMVAFAISTVLLILLNQHRFQPWAYHFILFALVMATCRTDTTRRLLRWLVISIYVYSAISKLDFQFLHSLGPQFNSVLLAPIGVDSSSWPNDVQVWLAMLFPIGELAIGLGLLIRHTRRVAVFAAIASHLLLLLILGPWGLSHQSGVLIWNVYFIAQAWMLFTDREPNVKTERIESKVRLPERLCVLLIIGVIGFPATEPLGFCDHWPAWELYSPRSSRVQVAIHESAIDRLPPKMQQHLSVSGAEGGWRQLHIDRWSLESLSVPIYPEDRFQLGVAMAVSQEYELGSAIHVLHQSTSDRRTGLRTERSYMGDQQLRNDRPPFRLNVRARQSRDE